MIRYTQKNSNIFATFSNLRITFGKTKRERWKYLIKAYLVFTTFLWYTKSKNPLDNNKSILGCRWCVAIATYWWENISNKIMTTKKFDIQTFGHVGDHEQVDESGSVSVSKQRHITRISIESVDVFLDPVQRCDLIHQSKIATRCSVYGRKKSCVNWSKKTQIRKWVMVQRLLCVTADNGKFI